MDTLSGVIAAIIIMIIISLILIKIGWVLFMVPVFGLPNLTWMQALGFALLASCLRSTNNGK